MVAITEETLLRKISQHRSNMNLAQVTPPFETLTAEIEDWICRRMKPRAQKKLCDDGTQYSEGVHWTSVMDFLKANVAFIASGREQTTQEEAERRASICADCPAKASVTGCGVCQRAIDEYRDRVVGAQPTSRDADLTACGVCKCDLKTIVHFPLEALRAKGDHDFPDWCWQKRGGINERDTPPSQQSETTTEQ